VGGSCSTHGTGEEIVQGFDGKARRKETKMGSKRILGRLAGGGVELFQLAQDRNQCEYGDER
jgi:hypothetical protein